MNKLNPYPFWAENPSIIFDIDRITEFYPSANLTNEEKHNAFSRFFVYLSLLLIVFYGELKYLWIAIVGLTLVWVHYYYGQQLLNIEKFDPDCEKSEIVIRQKTKKKKHSKKKINRDSIPNNQSSIDQSVNTSTNIHTWPNQKQQQSENSMDVANDGNFLGHSSVDLYANTEDLWNKKNFERQSNNNLSTNMPNDRDSFMKWCWGTTNVCRGNNSYPHT